MRGHPVALATVRASQDLEIRSGGQFCICPKRSRRFTHHSQPTAYCAHATQRFTHLSKPKPRPRRLSKTKPCAVAGRCAGEPAQMMPGQSLALRGPSLSPCHRVCRQARRRCDKWWAAAMAPMRSQLRAMAQALRWSRFSAASSGEAPPSTLSSGRALRRGLSSLQGNFVAARSATRRF